MSLIFSQVIGVPANATNTFSVNYQSTYVDWTLTIPNVGPEGLMTDTSYKLFITAKATSVPEFYNPKLKATGCQVAPTYELKPDAMVEPALWNLIGYFGIKGPSGELLVIDPSEPLNKLTEIFMQDVWTDMQNKHYLRGTFSNDRSKYYKLLDDGSIARKSPLTVKFDDPGFYDLDVNVSTMQLVLPVGGGRACDIFSIAPGFEIEDSSANIPFGNVTDKSSLLKNSTQKTVSNDKYTRSCIAINNELDLLRFRLKNAISKTKKTSMSLISVLNNAPSNLKCSSTKRVGFDIELKGKQKVLDLYKKTVNTAITKVIKK